MANDESLLREVDQELAEDRQWITMRKNAPLLIGGALAIVVGVAGWQIYSGQKEAASKLQALEYENALELLAEDAVQGRDALTAVIDAGGAYDNLARLRAAASYATDGERLRALGIYREIVNDGGAPNSLRDLAQIRAAQLSMADGRDAVLAELGSLTTEDGAFSAHAREIEGLAALDAQDFESALSTFRTLSIDFSAPESVRTRAEDFAALAEAGKAGVNVTGETRVEDLLDAIAPVTPGDGEGAISDLLNDAAAGGAIEDDHQGHNHGPGGHIDHEDIADQVRDVTDQIEELVDAGEEIVEDANLVDPNLAKPDLDEASDAATQEAE